MFVYRLVRVLHPAEEDTIFTGGLHERTMEDLGRREPRFMFKSSQRSRFRSRRNRGGAMTLSSR